MSSDTTNRSEAKAGRGEGTESNSRKDNDMSTNPHIAKTMADLLTPKQVVAIRAIANAQGKNAEAICRDRLKCLPEELSCSSASLLIDILKKVDEPKNPESLTASLEAMKQAILAVDCDSTRLWMAYREMLVELNQVLPAKISL